MFHHKYFHRKSVFANLLAGKQHKQPFAKENTQTIASLRTTQSSHRDNQNCKTSYLDKNTSSPYSRQTPQYNKRHTRSAVSKRNYLQYTIVPEDIKNLAKTMRQQIYSSQNKRIHKTSYSKQRNTQISITGFHNSQNLKTWVQKQKLLDQNKKLKYTRKSYTPNITNFGIKRNTNTPVNTLFEFPKVKIRLINQIKVFQQLQQKSILFSFETIWKKVIKNMLVGQFSQKFGYLIEIYLKQLYNKEYEQNNQQIFGLSQKNELIQKIKQYERLNEYSKIHNMIKYYCLPKRHENKQIMNQLIKEIVLLSFQKKNCNKGHQYCLLDVKGKQITELGQIYFTLNQLLLCRRTDKIYAYNQYVNILEQYKNRNKASFKQIMKQKLKQSIDLNIVNAPDNIHSYKKNNKNKAKKQQYYTFRLNSNEKRYKQIHLETNNQQNKKLHTNQPKKSIYSLTQLILEQKAEYQLVIQRIQQQLNRSSSLRNQQQFEQYFKQLFVKNQHYQFGFNCYQYNKQKILLNNLIQNWVILKNKSQKQLDWIKQTIFRLYHSNIQLIFIYKWQLKQLFQCSKGIARPEIITKFCLSFLNFNQYGEVNRNQFNKLIQIFFIGRYDSISLVQISIWNLLQKQRIVENQVIRKQKLQIWYQPVKFIILFFLSIIFYKQQ